MDSFYFNTMFHHGIISNFTKHFEEIPTIESASSMLEYLLPNDH